MRRDRIKLVVTRFLLPILLCHCAAFHVEAQLADLLGRLLESPSQTPHPAVVRVVAAETGATSMGSGCLIWVEGDYGWVVSNWHVVGRATGPIEVIFPDGFRTPAQVAKTDETWDLALLGIWRPQVEPVPLAEQVPAVGEQLTIAGYGRGSYRQARGVCRHYASPDPFQPQEMIELSVAARQGDSGGPILNSRGELAGVLFGSGSGMTTGSHIVRLKKFLASASAPELAATGIHQGDNSPSRDPAAVAPAEKKALAAGPFVQPTLAPPSDSLVGKAPPPFFPAAPLTSSSGRKLVASQPVPLDELDALQLADSDPLPFEELASQEPEAKWTRRIARTAEVQQQENGFDTEGSWERVATRTDPLPSAWQARATNTESAAAVQEQQVRGSRQAPLLEIPAAIDHVRSLPDLAEQPIQVQLPLPLTDTNAFLVFMALVATLIYALPRGTSKERPGSSTIG